MIRHMKPGISFFRVQNACIREGFKENPACLKIALSLEFAPDVVKQRKHSCQVTSENGKIRIHHRANIDFSKSEKSEHV